MKKLQCIGLLLLLGLTLPLQARVGGGGGTHDPDFSEGELDQGELLPWLTGPLLCPSGHLIPMGHVNFEPYFYWTKYSGFYDSKWNFQSTPHYFSDTLQLTLQIGVLPNTEFDVNPQFYYNRCKGQSDYRIGDLPITLAFQLFDGATNRTIPSLKLRFDANIPIGKYEHLNPKKLLTDSAGSGSWSPAVGLVSSQLFQFGTHFLAMRYFVEYGLTAATHVGGLSVYGGDAETRGTVYPGCSITAIVGTEYTLSQSWVLACDFQYVHQNKTRFSGHSPKVSVTSPSSENFSIAPAIEYNFNESIGLIGGAWVSFAGRNSSQYLNWVLALNVYR